MIDTLATTEEREAIPALPMWRVDVTFRGETITVYHNTDYDIVRKCIGDVVLAHDTSAVDIYRNGTLFRHIEVARAT